MVRAPYYDKNGVKKGAWSPEEDSKLKAYIERYGHWNWRELPKFAGLSRCGKSCRLRWMNYLRPNVKHGNFTEEEENTILRLHAELGNKWSIIAAKLPERTDNEIKNHWHTHLKKRARENPSNIEGKEKAYGVKEQSQSSSDSSKFEGNRSRDLYHPILESSPLSPEASSSEISCASCDFLFVSSTNHIEDGHQVTQEILEDSSEDFWTQPFVADHDNAFSLNNSQFAPSYSSFYDDAEELMYQVMQELPVN